MTGYLLDKKAPRNSTTKLCGEKCLEGAVLVQGGFGGRFGGYTVHFHMEWISDGADKVTIYNDTALDSGVKSAIGNQTGAIILTSSPKVEIHIGISYVSVENAKLNLQTEVGSKLFDQIKA